jgi:hypothetical protein
MIYYIDWFRVTCNNCGADFEYSLSDFDSYGLSIKLAIATHDREINNYRKCDKKDLIITPTQRMDKIEL